SVLTTLSSRIFCCGSHSGNPDTGDIFAIAANLRAGSNSVNSCSSYKDIDTTALLSASLSGNKELVEFDWDWHSPYPKWARVRHHSSSRSELMAMLKASSQIEDSVILYLGAVESVVDHSETAAPPEMIDASESAVSVLFQINQPGRNLIIPSLPNSQGSDIATGIRETKKTAKGLNEICRLFSSKIPHIYNDSTRNRWVTENAPSMPIRAVHSYPYYQPLIKKNQSEREGENEAKAQLNCYPDDVNERKHGRIIAIHGGIRNVKFFLKEQKSTWIVQAVGFKRFSPVEGTEKMDFGSSFLCPLLEAKSEFVMPVEKGVTLHDQPQVFPDGIRPRGREGGDVSRNHRHRGPASAHNPVRLPAALARRDRIRFCGEPDSLHLIPAASGRHDTSGPHNRLP
ncbi:3345_t:CDS:2, partial [Racocetra fulgida]